MKEEKPTVKNSSGKENEPVLENGRKKVKEERPATKVVVRRLPPSMTEEQFREQVDPLPDHDYFYFVAADMSLNPNAFSRAYVNFLDQSDLFIFTQKFDGYVFVDSKGSEFPAVVEFSPFQRIPKNRPNRKKDSKVGTIEDDPYFIAFKERLEAENLESKATANASKQHFFETSLVPDKKEETNTPLLDFIKNRRAERQRIREEKREEKRKKDLERRKAKEEQRRTKKEEDTSVVKVLNSQSASKEKLKENKEVKPAGFTKKKAEELKPMTKEKSSETRPKDTKTRTGKSYLEERQRLAERREERKKMSKSSSSVAEKKTSPEPEEKTEGADEATPAEEKPREHKSKEGEAKKPERVFKREETARRNSYRYDKYESRRDRESDDKTRTRKTTERSYQSSRRDEEKAEDGGRKRYSESRKGHESSQRDKYKDKKIYSQKKTSAEFEKSKHFTEKSTKSSIHSGTVDKDPDKGDLEVKEQGEDAEGKTVDKSDSTDKGDVATSDSTLKLKIFEQKDNTKPTRRKSLDYDKSRSSSTYIPSKPFREKYSEKKRRNSVGSGKHSQIITNQEDRDKANDTIDSSSRKSSTSKENLSKEEKLPASEKETPKTEDMKEGNSKHTFDEKDRDMPKRRNSTGECTEKSSPRRNSLGSEDKNQVFNFSEQKCNSGVMSEEEKSKDEKTQRGSLDPRTERRIRNKDRPTMELYRPGMGRFSRQRLEREGGRGLGSSTEVDSPSSSPSPTPNKAVNPH